MRIQRVLLLLVLPSIIVSLFTVAIGVKPEKASAQSNVPSGCPGGGAGPPSPGTVCPSPDGKEGYYWLNRSTIYHRNSSGTPDYYLIDQKMDDQYQYSMVNSTGESPGGCSVEINLHKFVTNGNVAIDYNNAVGPFDVKYSYCNHERTERTNLGDASNVNIVFVYKDRNHIVRTDYNYNKNMKMEFGTKATDAFFKGDSIFLRTDEQGEECQDFMLVKEGSVGANNTVSAYYQEISKSDNPGGFGGVSRDLSNHPFLNGEKCYIVRQVNDSGTGGIAGNVLVGNFTEFIRSQPKQSTFSGPDGSGSSEPTCESQGGALSWIMCPVIEALDSAFSWLDSQVQNLLVVPNPQDIRDSSTNKNNLHEVWGRIRNIALFILVPFMLLMVIGTALGLSFLDAYTVRKAMPRLLLAVLFISVSWPIIVFLITLTNAVGRGVLGLITQPFGGYSHSLADLISPEGGVAISGAGVLIFAGAITAGLVSVGIVMSFAFIAVLALLTGFVVLTLRQIIILVLVLFAPIAILGWIFPNTNKLWKFWWDNFSKLLLMFPLIMVLIGSSKIFATVIRDAGNSMGLDGVVKELVIVVAYITPYFFIPLTFKAGGSMFGSLAGAITNSTRGIRDSQKKYRHERAAQGWERKGGRRILQKRADLQYGWQKKAGKGFRGRLYGLASRGIGGYNIQADAAARTAAVGEEINKQIATGRDPEIRGSTVNKKAALKTVGVVSGGKDAAGRQIWDVTALETALWRTTSDGRREFKTLGGAWVSEGAVDEGHRKWGKDTFAQQAALSYEMRKAITDGDVQGIADRYETLATKDGGWGMTDSQASGALKGAGFENQNQHLEFKYMNTDGSVDYAGLAKEAYERKGSYPLAQMSAHTIERLAEAYDYDSGNPVENEQRRKQLEDVAEVFMTRYGGAGAANPDDPESMAAAQAYREAEIRAGRTPSEGVIQTNAPGAAAVEKAVRRFAVHTGVYHPLPPATDIGPTAPTPPDERHH